MEEEAAAAVGPDAKQQKRDTNTKPRSKRNRKRPRSEVLHTNDHLVVESNIQQLVIDGSIIPKSPLIRIIQPYPYTFSSFCKERWVGRTVLDVDCTEFGSYPASYYEAAIQQGRILVSDQTVDPSYKLKGKDVLLHTVHRHEPAVAVDSVTSPYVNVVAETDELVAFDKPSTLPVHPCGGYHRNSLMNLLQEETVYGKLYTIHRLDRLTSGLVVLAKTSAAAKEWGQAIQQRDCEKIYLARVKGRFGSNIPDSVPRLDGRRLPNHGEYEDYDSASAEDQDDDSGAARRRNAHGYWVSDGAGIPCHMSLQDFAKMELTVDEGLEALNKNSKVKKDTLLWYNFACPVRIEQPKIGVCAAGSFADLDGETYTKTVKPAQTAFAVLKHCASDDSTLLLVRPATGRTHQIRVHLQYLGHSIANDPNYGGSLWFGNPDGERACERAHAILNEPRPGGDDDGGDAASKILVTADVPATESEVQRMHNDYARGVGESLPDFIQRTCVWCARNLGKGVDERAMLEFLVRSPGLWLHALQYKVNALSFRTELPEWSRF